MPLNGPDYPFTRADTMRHAPLEVGVYGLYQHGAVIHYGRAARESSTIFYHLMRQSTTCPT